MGREELKVNCPTCGKRVVPPRPKDSPFFPFCCERCRLIDLGRWFAEEHRISDGTAGEDPPPKPQG